MATPSANAATAKPTLGPSIERRLAARSRGVRLSVIAAQHVDGGGPCLRSERPSAFPADRKRRLPASRHDTFGAGREDESSLRPDPLPDAPGTTAPPAYPTRHELARASVDYGGATRLAMSHGDSLGQTHGTSICHCAAGP